MTASDAKRRLAYLCLEAPREGQASYVHVHEIIAGLKRRGWEVDLWIPSYSDRWERPNVALRILQYFTMQRRLGMALGKYDALYVRAHPLAAYAALFARIRRLPVVHEINGTYTDLYVAHPVARLARGLFDRLQRWQFQWSTALITVTELLSNWARSQSSPATPRVEVIPNGANIDLFHPGAEPSADLAGHLPGRYVVFFGGLTRWHGVPDMIAALKSPAWPQDVSLVVVGDGPERAALEAVATNEPKLVLLGLQPYANVPGIVAKAIAGLVTINDPGGRSSSAGLAPLKLYETLACGIPAIVSDLPGQADLIRNHSCGLTYPVSDGDGLAVAVAQVSANSDEARAMGIRGCEVVRQYHSWDQRSADTDALLTALPRQEKH